MSERLYAQLRPDRLSLEQLCYIQTTLPRGRRVASERLHLTLIHFGIIQEVIEALPTDRTLAEAAVQRYIKRTQKILALFPMQEFTLRPIGFELFGEYQRTLVIMLEKTPMLVKLHDQLLDALKAFFTDCGIRDVEGYMRQDVNFKYALDITPHVTIAKGYNGRLPATLVQEVRFTFTIMPFEY